MTKAEQTRLFEDLVGVAYALKGKDKEIFDQLLSRHKDDEDLDASAVDQLQKLHATYKPRHSKQELEEMWNKMRSGGKKE